jgi:hypothetical protein
MTWNGAEEALNFATNSGIKFIKPAALESLLHGEDYTWKREARLYEE